MSQVVGLDMVTGMGFIGLEPGRLYKMGRSPKLKDQTASGNPLLLNSAAAPFTSLALYGWSKQDGTPSPDNPVPIVSAGSVMIEGKNLLNIDNIPEDGITSNGITITKKSDGSVHVQGTSVDSVSIRLCYVTLNSGTYTLSGDSGDAGAYPYRIRALKFTEEGLNGDAYDDTRVLTQTIESDNTVSGIYLQVSAGQIINADVYPMLNAGDVPLPWEPYTGGQPAANPYEGEIGVTVSDGNEQSQSLTVSAPGGLPGIPVTVSRLPEGMTPTYVDESGQAWVCDEVDFERGVYVRRVWKRTFDGSENWSLYGTANGHNGFNLNVALPEIMDRRNGFSTQYEVRITAGSADKTQIWLGVNNVYLYAVAVEQRDESLEDKGLANWKAYLAAHPLEVMTYLTTATEEPLSPEELAQYASLHTYSPTTTVSNDAEAWMGVGYKVEDE